MRWFFFLSAVLLLSFGCTKPNTIDWDKVFGDKDAAASSDDDSVAGDDLQPDETLPDDLTDEEVTDETGEEETPDEEEDTATEEEPDSADTVEPEGDEPDPVDDEEVAPDDEEEVGDDATVPDDDLLDEDMVEADAWEADMVEADAWEADIVEADTVDEDIVPDVDLMPVLCTGQTKCYDGTAEITCPTVGNDFYGQDAQYAALGYCMPRSYSISGAANNDIVTDNVTGLIWQRTVNTNTYTWAEAITYCENLTYGGQTDWRLPSRKELATLPDYGRYDPVIDTVIFPGTQSSYYWTSSSSVGFTGAWDVNFQTGTVNSNRNKANTSYARCVKGDAVSDSSFAETTVASKVIVTDTETGLIWTKEYSATTLTWQNALGYCENLDYGGHADWRLPNIEELKSLTNDSLYDPTSNFPGILSQSFWSSSSHAYSTSNAWYVNFQYGNLSNNSKGNTYYARCVRGAAVAPVNECVAQSNPCDDGGDAGASCNNLSGSYSCNCSLGWFDNGNTCEEIIGVLCTGQTKCYNDGTVEITCPTVGNDFYGQDAQYAALGYCTPRSYSISGAANNDIVTDNVTGLIWQRTLPATYEGCTGGDPVGSMCTWQDALDYCAELNYGGYTDWRLPTHKELSTLPDYGRYDPVIDTAVFSDTPSNYFWSSSSDVSNTAAAWYVYFASGYVGVGDKTNTYYAQCVRGSALQANLFTEMTVEGKVIVTDTITGLLWTKEYSATTLAWQDALNYCESLDYGGSSDWRLPNIGELGTLNDDSIYSPASSFPGGMPSSWFWSSSSNVNTAANAWTVYFKYGGVNNHGKTNTYYARCVR